MALLGCAGVVGAVAAIEAARKDASAADQAAARQFIGWDVFTAPPSGKSAEAVAIGGTARLAVHAGGELRVRVLSLGRAAVLPSGEADYGRGLVLASTAHTIAEGSVVTFPAAAAYDVTDVTGAG